MSGATSPKSFIAHGRSTWAVPLTRLVPLAKSLHHEFHKGLDEYLPKWRGTAYYESLGPTERQQALQHLAAYTKNFDAEHGTKLYGALLNGFPAP
jgi:hypothetical protein